MPKLLEAHRQWSSHINMGFNRSWCCAFQLSFLQNSLNTSSFGVTIKKYWLLQPLWHHRSAPNSRSQSVLIDNSDRWAVTHKVTFLQLHFLLHSRCPQVGTRVFTGSKIFSLPSTQTSHSCLYSKKAFAVMIVMPLLHIYVFPIAAYPDPSRYKETNNMVLFLICFYLICSSQKSMIKYCLRFQDLFLLSTSKGCCELGSRCLNKLLSQLEQNDMNLIELVSLDEFKEFCLRDCCKCMTIVVPVADPLWTCWPGHLNILRFYVSLDLTFTAFSSFNLYF